MSYEVEIEKCKLVERESLWSLLRQWLAKLWRLIRKEERG